MRGGWLLCYSGRRKYLFDNCASIFTQHSGMTFSVQRHKRRSLLLICVARLPIGCYAFRVDYDSLRYIFSDPA